MDVAPFEKKKCSSVIEALTCVEVYLVVTAETYKAFRHQVIDHGIEVRAMSPK
jgi:hypothetical protein